jgi:hypothetical protein
MLENFNAFEAAPEHIPTPEEVSSIFKKLTEKEQTEGRKLEDEKGLYLLEITTPGDIEGEVNEYAYMRKGKHNEGQTSSTSIQITTYDKDGVPYWGTTVAECVDGKWEIL